MVIKMLTKFKGRRKVEHSEDATKKILEVTALKNIIAVLINTLERFNSRLEAEKKGKRLLPNLSSTKHDKQRRQIKGLLGHLPCECLLDVIL